MSFQQNRDLDIAAQADGDLGDSKDSPFQVTTSRNKRRKEVACDTTSGTGIEFLVLGKTALEHEQARSEAEMRAADLECQVWALKKAKQDAEGRSEELERQNQVLTAENTRMKTLTALQGDFPAHLAELQDQYEHLDNKYLSLLRTHVVLQDELLQFWTGWSDMSKELKKLRRELTQQVRECGERTKEQLLLLRAYTELQDFCIRAFDGNAQLDVKLEQEHNVLYEKYEETLRHLAPED